MTTLEVPLGLIDEGVRDFRQAQAFRQARGFKGNYFLIDRKNDETIVITLWVSEADLQASTQVAARPGKTQPDVWVQPNRPQ